MPAEYGDCPAVDGWGRARCRPELPLCKTGLPEHKSAGGARRTLAELPTRTRARGYSMTTFLRSKLFRKTVSQSSWGDNSSTDFQLDSTG